MLGPNRYRLVVCRLWNFHCLLLFHEFHESFLDFPYFFSLLDFFIWIDLIAKFIVDSCATSPCAPGELCVCVSFRFHISGAQLDISLYSSVAEHWSCKPGVVSSILTGGSCFLFLVLESACLAAFSWNMFSGYRCKDTYDVVSPWSLFTALLLEND